MSARSLVLAAAALAALAAGAARAAAARPFDARSFAAAQAQGRPIVVDVAADWCPTCRAQAPIVERLAADPSARATVVFRLDFDSQKAEERSLGVRKQSTLIAFRGREERDRLVGATDPERLGALFEAARR